MSSLAKQFVALLMLVPVLVPFAALADPVH